MPTVGLAGLLLALAASGCGPTHHETDIGPLPNGVTLKILYPLGRTTVGGSTAGSGSPRYAYSWTCGDVRLELDDLRLSVNGRDYGLLKAGDAVLLDARREVRVLVNGVERLPVEKLEGRAAPNSLAFPSGARWIGRAPRTHHHSEATVCQAR